MWLAFRAGAGIYSLLWANGASALYTVTATVVYASKRDLLPTRMEFGLPERADFSKVLHLSHNIFLNQIGAMILNVSQAILLGRFAGLEAVGVWSVGSKLYSLILQSADKIVQSAGPICAEMWSRGEAARFDHRLGQLKRLAILAVSIGAAVLIAFNSELVAVWTGSRIAWDPTYNYLLAMLFACRVFAVTESVPIVASKLYKGYRYIPLAEAACFALFAALLIPSKGIIGLIAAALVGVITITIPYIVYREQKRIGHEKYQASFSGLLHLAAAVLPSAAAWLALQVLSGQVNVMWHIVIMALLVPTSCLPIVWVSWIYIKTPITKV
jgi:O-antigen/teichoic acid export membrane protein